MTADDRHPPSECRALACANCGGEADVNANGWRALHGRGEPEDQPEPEAFVFCPVCWQREFGGGT